MSFDGLKDRLLNVDCDDVEDLMEVLRTVYDELEDGCEKAWFNGLITGITYIKEHHGN